MLENLALSISTALFFLCNLFVYSLIPSLPSDTDTPDTPIFEADLHKNVPLDGGQGVFYPEFCKFRT